MKLLTITTLIILPFFLFAQSSKDDASQLVNTNVSQIHYDFNIGSCQSMFAEQRYKTYMELFNSTTKNGVPAAKTRIKKHIAVTENVTIYEIGGSTQLTIIVSFTQKSDSCFGSIEIQIGKSNVFQTQSFKPSQQGLENFINRYILKVQREWIIALILNQNDVFLSMSKEKKAIGKQITEKLKQNVKLISKIEKMEIKVSENNLSIEELKIEEERIKILIIEQKLILESINNKLNIIKTQ